MVKRVDIIAIANNYTAMQFFKKKAKGYKGIKVADLVQIYLEQEEECALCGDKLELDTQKTHVDHIVPKAKGGENWTGNLELVCAACNYAKRDMSLKDFILLCLKVENKYHNTELLPKDVIRQIVEKRWRKENTKQRKKV